jgi:hypothetical protein
MPTRGASGGHVKRLRGSGRGTFGRMDAPEASGPDILSIALLVFFVSLILTVAALLILPIVF